MGPVDLLGHDALGAKIARVGEHGRPVLGNVFIEQDAYFGVRREADITRQLAAIIEFTMEYFANEHRGKLRTDRLELMESLNLSLR